MDRVGLLAVVAASQALEDAGSPAIDPGRIGAVIANVHGGADTVHRSYAEFFRRGADRVSPFTIPLGLTNSPVAAVARIHVLRGPSSTVATACAAGTDAIGLAVSLIRSGAADAMLAGGAEAPVSPFIVAAYMPARRALDERTTSRRGVTAVRSCPGRLRHRRGCRDPVPRGARPCARPRCTDPRRGRRLCQQLRCRPPDPAGPDRRRPSRRDQARAGRRRSWIPQASATSTRTRRRPRSATSPKHVRSSPQGSVTPPSRRRSRCTDTRSEPPGASKRSPR